MALIAPLLSDPCARVRSRRLPVRKILNAIYYTLGGGITGRLLPSGLLPKSTVSRWFSLCRDAGLFKTVSHLLVIAGRERVGKEASPTSAVLDNQNVDTTVGHEPVGKDTSQKVKDCKRQVVIDTDKRDLFLDPRQGGHAGPRWRASGHVPVAAFLPFITTTIADSYCAGEAPISATSTTIGVVRTPPDHVGHLPTTHLSRTRNADLRGRTKAH